MNSWKAGKLLCWAERNLHKIIKKNTYFDELYGAGLLSGWTYSEKSRVELLDEWMLKKE